MSDYPEHDKLTKVRDSSQLIGEFLDWAGQQGMSLCTCEESEYRRERDAYIPVRKRIEDLLAEFYEINLTKLEHEKQAMLDALRKAQAK